MAQDRPPASIICFLALIRRSRLPRSRREGNYATGWQARMAVTAAIGTNLPFAWPTKFVSSWGKAAVVMPLPDRQIMTHL